MKPLKTPKYPTERETVEKSKRGRQVGTRSMIIAVDQKGQEIREGDIVMKCWGWFKIGKGSAGKPHFMIHTVLFDQEDKRYILGNSFNKWSGKEVVKVTKRSLKT